MDGRHHSERAVQATAGRNGVEVRADQDRLASSGIPPADQIPCRIDIRLEP